MTAPSPAPTPKGLSADLPRADRGQGLRVAVLGATGLVGREMLRLLEERDLHLHELRPLASPRSAGRRIPFRGQEVEVQAVSAETLSGLDLVLASAGGDASREWLPVAAELGAVCVDNSSAFRMHPEVPLVVPEVNAAELRKTPIGGSGAIVANPNCSTIQLAVALAPLHAAFGLERVLVSTYQSISGAGARALEDFERASRERLADPAATAPEGVLAFDVLARIGDLGPDGSTTEEVKMIRELPRILGTEVPVDVTCVRVPVHVGHAESVVLQTREPVDVNAARRVLRGAAGVQLVASPEELTPKGVVGEHAVRVGRLRASATLERGLQLWVVADNLLKGAAWNAVQIAERLVAEARPSGGDA